MGCKPSPFLFVIVSQGNSVSKLQMETTADANVTLMTGCTHLCKCVNCGNPYGSSEATKQAYAANLVN